MSPNDAFGERGEKPLPGEPLHKYLGSRPWTATPGNDGFERKALAAINAVAGKGELATVWATRALGRSGLQE